MKVLVNLVYDREYKGYVADVPQLPGCMSQGKTAAAALKNVRQAVRLYLKETGRKRIQDASEVITRQIEVSV